jgi:peptidoglycan hydrolase-like protein with peptidoglycan-binding domain
MITGKYPVCKKGSKGLAVEWIQAAVGATVDGDYGSKTEAAVKSYQTKKKLTSDGWVGAKTWAAIIADLT